MGARAAAGSTSVGVNHGGRVLPRSSGAEGNGVNDVHDSEREARAVRGLLRSFGSTSSYGLVLVLLIVTYVLAVTLTEQWGATILLFAQMATVWLALRTSMARRGLRLIATVLFILAGIAAVANLLAQQDPHFTVAAFLAAAVLYFVAPFAIVRHIGYRRTVDQETLLGALAAYLFIGMAFAFAYRLLGAVQASPFFGANGDGAVSQDLFFSFITLTTTGYGNLVPAGNPGQTLAVLEALTGQLFLVTAVAKIVSAWRPRRWQESGPDAATTPEQAVQEALSDDRSRNPARSESAEACMPDSIAVPGWSRRVAAVVALAASIGALAIALTGVAAGTGWALMTFLCLLMVVVSTWTWLTRRGILRVLGVTGTLAGLGGFVVVQVIRWRGLALFALVIALLLVFAVSGRYAIGRDPRGARRERRLRVGPAGHGVVIINAKSGGGKATRFDIRGEASKRGVRVIVLQPGDDLGELAERAIAAGADVVGMAGGDGSQAVVAEAAMRHGIPHVCIPAGTRNHFAVDLGLDRDDVVGALDAFTDGVERRIDLARVNDQVFVNNASLGVYARVVQSHAYRDAKLETWVRLLPGMLGPDAPPIDLEFEGPGGTHYDDAVVILVSNNPYQLVQLAGVGTRPRLDTGRLGLLAARVRTARDVTELTTLEAIGQARRFRGLLEWSSAAFEVRSGSPVAVGLDGEALVLDPPLRFSSLPGALRVRLPRRASWVSPASAAVSLTREDAAALYRVATGKPPYDSDRGRITAGLTSLESQTPR
jgi:diacylglycerol kinase family enzyme